MEGNSRIRTKILIELIKFSFSIANLRKMMIPPSLQNSMESLSKKIFKCDWIRYVDPSMSLFEIFKTYGGEDKNECPKFTLYYDFKPYNSTEPVLLALMIKGANFKKTI